MVTKYRIVSAELISVAKPQYSHKRKKEYQLLLFRDLSDSHEYVLCVIRGNQKAARFLKFPVGTRLAGLVVYEDRGKEYISVESNFSRIKARPLF